jgi:tetratricopeptide (TPR) repeat protein
MNANRNIILNAAVIVIALSCVACASAPQVPDRQLASAKTGIEMAEQNGAREFGPAALERARKQLEQARIAAANKEYDHALYLAKRAELDAELAMAQTNHGKSALALQEIQESIQTLRREIARNQSS